MKTEDCNQLYTKNIQSNAHSGKSNNEPSLTCHMSIVPVHFWCQTVNIGKFGSNYVHVQMCNSETQKCNQIQESQAFQYTAQSLLNLSALTSIHGIDLCFFTCYRSLYVVKLARSNAAYLNAYLLHVWRSLKFPMMKLQPSI